MGLVDTVAVAAAERLEKSLGAEAALAAYRPLVTRLAGGEARARAALGALRCAERLGDAATVAEIAPVWSTLTDARDGDAVAPLVRALASRGLDRAAAELASAEAERAPSARSLYLAARCKERIGDADAVALYARAAERGAREPDGGRYVAAARARRVERLAADPARRGEALAEALATPLDGATRAQKLALARARLAAPSPFARASALSILEELARPVLESDARGAAPPQDAIARAAMLLAAWHADARADTLAPVEEDRIVAALAHWPDPEAREAAIARVRALSAIARARGALRDDAAAKAAVLDPALVPLLARAHAVLAGAGQGAFPGASGDGAPGPSARLLARALDAIAAAMRGADADLARALEACTSLARSAEVIPAAVGVALEHGLARRPARDAAAALAEVLLEQMVAPPSAGFARFAEGLRRAGRDDLALRALRRGAAEREAASVEQLAGALVREGHRLAARGERDSAIAALREAKALAVKR